jgi:hypothetical protein
VHRYCQAAEIRTAFELCRRLATARRLPYDLPARARQAAKKEFFGPGRSLSTHRRRRSDAVRSRCSRQKVLKREVSMESRLTRREETSRERCTNHFETKQKKYKALFPASPAVANAAVQTALEKGDGVASYIQQREDCAAKIEPFRRRRALSIL